MTTTEMNNAKTNPGKLTFGRAVKAVLLFPFKVLAFAIKVTLVLVLAGVVTTVGYGVYRSGQPMVVPEAQGMTYREFLKERLGAMKALDDASAERDDNRVCVSTATWIKLPSTEKEKLGGKLTSLVAFHFFFPAVILILMAFLMPLLAMFQ